MEITFKLKFYYVVLSKNNMEDSSIETLGETSGGISGSEPAALAFFRGRLLAPPVRPWGWLASRGQDARAGQGRKRGSANERDV